MPVDYSEELDLAEPTEEDIEAEIEVAMERERTEADQPSVELDLDLLVSCHCLDDSPPPPGPSPARASFLLSLSILRLDRLRLSSAPGHVLGGCLPNVTHVYLQHNRLKSLDGLASLPRLKFLSASHNKLGPTLGRALAALTGLMFVDVSHNAIEALSADDLPQCVCFMQLEGNPVAQGPGADAATSQLLVHLPKLRHLDGQVSFARRQRARTDLGLPPLPPDAREKAEAEDQAEAEEEAEEEESGDGEGDGDSNLDFEAFDDEIEGADEARLRQMLGMLDLLDAMERSVQTQGDAAGRDPARRAAVRSSAASAREAAAALQLGRRGGAGAGGAAGAAGAAGFSSPGRLPGGGAPGPPRSGSPLAPPPRASGVALARSSSGSGSGAGLRAPSPSPPSRPGSGSSSSAPRAALAPLAAAGPGSARASPGSARAAAAAAAAVAAGPSPHSGGGGGVGASGGPLPPLPPAWSRAPLERPGSGGSAAPGGGGGGGAAGASGGGGGGESLSDAEVAADMERLKARLDAIMRAAAPMLPGVPAGPSLHSEQIDSMRASVAMRQRVQRADDEATSASIRSLRQSGGALGQLHTRAAATMRQGAGGGGGASVSMSQQLQLQHPRPAAEALLRRSLEPSGSGGLGSTGAGGGAAGGGSSGDPDRPLESLRASMQRIGALSSSLVDMAEHGRPGSASSAGAGGGRGPTLPSGGGAAAAASAAQAASSAAVSKYQRLVAARAGRRLAAVGEEGSGGEGGGGPASSAVAGAERRLALPTADGDDDPTDAEEPAVAMSMPPNPFAE
ncbi:hypothetical protein FOA52_007855 [Chlamydomonas sp. UWO 241]|nr:hypothetical protein FOA52_007855 [Chlamydomonas sp. UWO 241]